MALNIIDQFKISPPSVPTTSVPLSFFDLPWFLCRPVQRLIFFQFLHPISYFIHDVLPHLKHSLSLTLQHFFPLVANLNYPSPPRKPFILFSDGGSIPFTIAESMADFNQVISSHPKDVIELHPYVPKLPSPYLAPDGTRVAPLLALQITVFPNTGISMGFKLALTTRYYHSMRDAIKDPSDLESIFLKELTKEEAAVGTDAFKWVAGNFESIVLFTVLSGLVYSRFKF